MTDLERRALLGDKQAQEECTQRGIVLACPLCKSNITVSIKGHLFHCKSCNFTLTFPAIISKAEALMRFNTRPEPPIGRCGECKKWGDKDCMYKGLTFNSDFCSYFDPKGGEENGRTAAD